MMVTFCGHKDNIYKKETEEKLHEILEDLIRKGADKADVVVAYVKYGYGGALNILEYAKRKEKEIINFAVKEDNFVYLHKDDKK